MTVPSDPTPAEVDLALVPVRARVLSAVTLTRSPRRSQRFRVVQVAVVATVLAPVLTAGAIVVRQATLDEVSHTAICYSSASTWSESTTVSTAVATEIETGVASQPEILDPVDACDDMWRMGIIGQETVPEDPNASDFSVPDLVGCRQSNGVGAAFPRETLSTDDAQACGSLGMEVWKD